MYIYILQDPINFEIRYVGKTTSNLNIRLKNHIKKSELIKDTYKTRWIEKLLKNNLIPLIKEVQCFNNIDIKQLNEAERYWIKYFKEQGCNLTNLTSGGDGLCGYEFSPEHRAKIGFKNKQRKISEETKNKISKSKKEYFKNNPAPKGKDHWNFGVKRSEQSRKKQSLTLINLEKRGQNHPLFGKKLSETTKTKISLSLLGNNRKKGKGFFSEEKKITYSRNRGGKPFKDQFGNVYQTIRGAARELELNPTLISNVLKGKQHSTKGYVFNFLNTSDYV